MCVCSVCVVCIALKLLSRRSRRASFKSSRSKRVDDGYEPEESGEQGAANLKDCFLGGGGTLGSSPASVSPDVGGEEWRGGGGLGSGEKWRAGMEVAAEWQLARERRPSSASVM